MASALIDAVVAALPLVAGSTLSNIVGSKTETHSSPVFGQDSSGNLIVTSHVVTTTNTLTPLGAGIVAVAMLMALAVWIWNFGFRQGRTGQSLGNSALGIRVLKESTARPLGAGAALGRQIMHIVDVIPCYVGYLWPLWDSKRQTFADKIVGSVVVMDAPQQTR